MTNYTLPATTPEQIEKLPDGVYLDTVGNPWMRTSRWWATVGYAEECDAKGLAARGGIVARLVSDTELREAVGLLRQVLEYADDVCGFDGNIDPAAHDLASSARAFLAKHGEGECARATRQQKAVSDVLAERDRQDAKWGPDRTHSPMEWVVISGEEQGEACEAALHTKWPDDAGAAEWVRRFRTEMVQLAAVAIACVESIDLQHSVNAEGKG